MVLIQSECLNMASPWLRHGNADVACYYLNLFLERQEDKEGNDPYRAVRSKDNHARRVVA
jgi:hypothetical protein